MPTFCDVTEADLDALRRTFGAGAALAAAPRPRTRGPRAAVRPAAARSLTPRRAAYAATLPRALP